MIDEFNAFDAPHDWMPSLPSPSKYPKLSSKLDVFIAAEPLSWSKFNHDNKRIENKYMVKLLPTKHRNCESIDKFVSVAIRETGGLTKGKPFAQ